MKLLSTIFTTLFCGAILFAQGGNNVIFTFHHKAGTAPLELEHGAFSIWNGKKVMLTRAEFYISEIELLKPDSSILPLHDVYLLPDASSLSQDHPVGNWDVDEIIGLTLHLGVDSVHNHLDPSTYPLEHPLAHQKNSMHWGWLAGYRFMAIEGFIDNNGDGVPETELQFHNIGDAIYKTVKISGVERAQNGALHLHIDLDYAKLFEDMGMTGNLIEHGTGPANEQMMENAATKDFIRIAQVSGVGNLLANSHQVHIAPNPMSTLSIIGYDFDLPGQVALVIINAQGQRVRAFDSLPARGSLSLQAENLPNGVYRCVFYQNGRVVAGKPLVINR